MALTQLASVPVNAPEIQAHKNLKSLEEKTIPYDEPIADITAQNFDTTTHSVPSNEDDTTYLPEGEIDYAADIFDRHPVYDLEPDRKPSRYDIDSLITAPQDTLLNLSDMVRRGDYIEITPEDAAKLNASGTSLSFTWNADSPYDSQDDILVDNQAGFIAVNGVKVLKWSTWKHPSIFGMPTVNGQPRTDFRVPLSNRAVRNDFLRKHNFRDRDAIMEYLQENAAIPPDGQRFWDIERHERPQDPRDIKHYVLQQDSRKLAYNVLHFQPDMPEGYEYDMRNNQLILAVMAVESKLPFLLGPTLDTYVRNGPWKRVRTSDGLDTIHYSTGNYAGMAQFRVQNYNASAIGSTPLVDSEGNFTGFPIREPINDKEQFLESWEAQTYAAFYSFQAAAQSVSARDNLSGRIAVIHQLGSDTDLNKADGNGQKGRVYFRLFGGYPVWKPHKDLYIKGTALLDPEKVGYSAEYQGALDEEVAQNCERVQKTAELYQLDLSPLIAPVISGTDIALQIAADAEALRQVTSESPAEIESSEEPASSQLSQIESPPRWLREPPELPVEQPSEATRTEGGLGDLPEESEAAIVKIAPESPEPEALPQKVEEPLSVGKEIEFEVIQPEPLEPLEEVVRKPEADEPVLEDISTSEEEPLEKIVSSDDESPDQDVVEESSPTPEFFPVIVDTPAVVVDESEARQDTDEGMPDAGQSPAAPDPIEETLELDDEEEEIAQTEPETERPGAAAMRAGTPSMALTIPLDDSTSPPPRSSDAFSRGVKTFFGALGVGSIAYAAAGGEKDTEEKRKSAEQKGETFRPKRRWFLRIAAAIVGVLAIDLVLRGKRSIIGPATEALMNSVSRGSLSFQTAR